MRHATLRILRLWLTGWVRHAGSVRVGSTR